MSRSLAAASTRGPPSGRLAAAQCHSVRTRTTRCSVPHSQNEFVINKQRLIGREDSAGQRCDHAQRLRLDAATARDPIGVVLHPASPAVSFPVGAQLPSAWPTTKRPSATWRTPQPWACRHLGRARLTVPPRRVRHWPAARAHARPEARRSSPARTAPAIAGSRSVRIGTARLSGRPGTPRRPRARTDHTSHSFPRHLPLRCRALCPR